MRTTPIPVTALPTTVTSPRPADQLERAFLEEMLKYAGPKAATDSFGGGIGEQQFTTFLTREYAALLADSLDFGFTFGTEKDS